MKEYLKKHIETFKKEMPFRILSFEKVKPYVNSIPLLDISAAAGNFSELQQHSDLTWVELPFHISVEKGYFVSRVIGESMNKKIPNGSYCLFKKDEGGSRNGKIVLLESTNIQDSEFGSGHTVKEYHSNWSNSEEDRTQISIELKPLSTNPEYSSIELKQEELTTFKVIGIFEKVLV